jgi:four helix bundle protein
MTTKPEVLRERTKQFALRVIRLCRALPKTEESRVIGRQLLRAATSVAANYRAACRARSRAEFNAKTGIVLEEADESFFWLELLGDAGIVPKARLSSIMQEAEELTRIFYSSIQTSRRKS